MNSGLSFRALDSGFGAYADLGFRALALYETLVLSQKPIRQKDCTTLLVYTLIFPAQQRGGRVQEAWGVYTCVYIYIYIYMYIRKRGRAGVGFRI